MAEVMHHSDETKAKLEDHERRIRSLEARKLEDPEPPFCEECLGERKDFIRTTLDKNQTTGFKKGWTAAAWVCPKCGHTQVEKYEHGRLVR